MTSTDLEPLRAQARAVIDNIRDVIVGKDDAVELLVACLFAGGHALIEDRPGLGKTTLADALARTICGDRERFRRIQCTPDLMPTDITGFTRYDASGAARFVPGPLFAHVVLADELNRATPRTQSALLEAMNERQVSADGTTHPLPRPFMLVATQNPQEFAGTFPLPIAQLDRFTIVLSLDYASEADERRILVERLAGNPLDRLQAISAPDEVTRIARLVESAIQVHPAIIDYVVRLTRATRGEPDVVMIGASPRGALQLVHLSRAMAFLRGREYVTPDDVKQLARHVLLHRLMPAEDGGDETREELRRFIDDLVARTPAPARQG